jgi:hypothetical protein
MDEWRLEHGNLRGGTGMMLYSNPHYLEESSWL